MSVRPYYEAGGVTLFAADLRAVEWPESSADVAICDPPYGETSLAWDRRVEGWLDIIGRVLKPEGTFWCFGSLRLFMALAERRTFDGWQVAQEVVWEKQNGTNFHADRFKRVHELIVQFYRRGVAWERVYKSPVHTLDAVARVTRRKRRPTHTGHIEASAYVSEDGGPRMMRSVIYARNCHGYAVHPTQKPLDVVVPLIRYSCPPGGLVFSPFAGSGTDLVAARLLGMRATGTEIRPEYAEAAAQRLASERDTLQDTLPLEPAS